MKSLFSALTSIGIDVNDKHDLVLQKRSLVYQAVLMSIGGLIWGLLALAFEKTSQSAIPFSYTILSIANLYYFHRFRKFRIVKTFQSIISLLLPFIFQFSLGGFVASGGVMLWAFLSLAIAVTYNDSKEMIFWTVLYLVLTITAGVFDSLFFELYGDAKLIEHSSLFFVVNISVISIIIMMLINFIYSQKSNAIEQLQSAQKKLVQTEKLASLGALTAGIAHEIKNPLNFVNNFSELSNDLIEEFLEAKDDIERKEIAADLKLNLKKINEHGKRADSIVKNMLQHSRNGSVEKQPTDINKLCEEYLNLAFHGKRAGNPDFNCELIKQFDDNLPMVNCMAQDVSRVILNLINNAFDAVKEKSDTMRSEGHLFNPVVTIITKNRHEHIEIVIRDNGNGISPDKKEKIFEPFFTTKPAGQGTGLGLSLSFDIVKAHDGTIEVNTHSKEGTEFKVCLPVK